MKTNLKLSTAICLALASAPVASAADGIMVEHLGTNNTLLRVDPECGRYLLMPVQDAGDEATVNVVVDGKIDRTVVVRLAKGKVDYSVPLDLERYRGHNVVLNILTSQTRANVREAKEDACWSNFSITDDFDLSDRETKYRPAYHHTPLWGWMNDPNGMFYNDGRWHLYYQWNPFGSKWQNMTWGHSSTTDLVNWEHHPVAIEPDGIGTIFSGSSVVDHNNTAGAGKGAVVALYTSAGASQMQSMATSTDGGLTFKGNPANPILTMESEARDPNMFWHEPTGKWVMILAHPLEHEMMIFNSDDLRHWIHTSSFGKGLGGQDGVWECPDLMELPVEGSDMKKWVLISNINPGGPFGGSAVQYFTGDFDGKTFTPDTDAQGNVATKWMDHGKDNYALVSFSGAPEGRNTVIGWMSNWQYAADVPTMQYRSANTVARDLSLFADAEGNLLVKSSPVEELKALRGSRMKAPASFSVNAKGRTLPLPVGNSAGVCEVVMTIDACNARSVSVALANTLGEKVSMTYNPAEDTIDFDRRKSGVTDFSVDFPAVTVTKAHGSGKGIVELRLLMDRSSAELFVNGGRGVMTNLVFPNNPYSSVTVASEGGRAKVSDFAVYPLN